MGTIRGKMPISERACPMSMTEALIGKAKPREKGYKLYDFPGLSLLVAPRGMPLQLSFRRAIKDSFIWGLAECNAWRGS